MERPVDKEIEVVIDYSSFKSFDPYGFPGFPGMLSRLQQMKELLDDQWGIDTVYQDQYPSLLYATETGRMITAQPSLVTTGIMDQFKMNLLTGIDEVCMHVKRVISNWFLDQILHLRQHAISRFYTWRGWRSEAMTLHRPVAVA